MGFMIGCYSTTVRPREIDYAIKRMSSFFLECGFRHDVRRLGPHCTVGWVSKEGVSVPVVETPGGYLFGEIDLYNRPHLEAKLRHRQSHAGSASDLALVADFIEAFGDSAISEVNGDFVLGCQDRHSGRLRLFRDHFGVRSLFYAIQCGATYWSSAVPALLRLGGAFGELDLGSLAMYLLFGSPRPNRTYYANVLPLPPSSSVVVDRHSSHIPAKYWSPGPSRFAEGLNQDEIIPAFRELLIEAVESRVAKEGQTAISLSGGLDSSTITSIACRRYPDRSFPSVTIVLPEGYQGDRTDEKAYIEALSSKYANLEPHFEDGLGADPLGSSDDPLLRGGPNENHFEYIESSLGRRATSLGANVLLSGMGGDFCVSDYAASYLIEALLRLRFDLAWSEVAQLREKGNRLQDIAKHRVILPLLPLSLLRWRWKIIGTDWTNHSSLSAQAFRDLDLWQDVKQGGYDAIQQFSRTVREEEIKILKHFLTRHTLARDLNEIKSGVTLRYPLLDFTLIEAALSLPFTQKKNPSEQRALLRNTSRSFLPVKISERTDKGHANPHFRARLAGCEGRLRAGFAEFRSNEVWRYLVDSKKIEGALPNLRNNSASSPDNALMTQICRPYELGRFLMAVHSSTT